jgi:hypothetical protein
VFFLDSLRREIPHFARNDNAAGSFQQTANSRRGDRHGSGSGFHTGDKDWIEEQSALPS